MPHAAAPAGWDRRDFISGAALLALVLGVPVAAAALSDLPAGEAPSERQRRLMREVAQLVVPRTDTPGAGDVGTAAFVILALAHGLESSRAPSAGAAAPQLARFRRGDGSLRHVAWLEHELDRRAGGDFLRRPAKQRADTLAALDAEAFAEGVREHPWRTIKGLVLTGYYTSEAGATRELRYELVPGRFDADLPLHPGDRAWSSDWTAVEFG
ncbi:MAG: gluconate 2-dehydrogenase subunit 3 family protein [Novosphingobium sp.]